MSEKKTAVEQMETKVNDLIQKKNKEIAETEAHLKEMDAVIMQASKDKEKAVSNDNMKAYHEASERINFTTELKAKDERKLEVLKSDRSISEDENNAIYKAVVTEQNKIIADQDEKIRTLLDEIKKTVADTNEKLVAGNKVIIDLEANLYANTEKMIDGRVYRYSAVTILNIDGNDFVKYTKGSYGNPTIPVGKFRNYGI
jgi:uncharacterized coiled-coil protein SlyX